MHPEPTMLRDWTVHPTRLDTALWGLLVSRFRAAGYISWPLPLFRPTQSSPPSPLCSLPADFQAFSIPNPSFTSRQTMAGDAFDKWILELELNLEFEQLEGGGIEPPQKLNPLHLGFNHPDIDPKYNKPVQAGCFRVLAKDGTVKYLIYAYPDSDRDEYARIKWPFGFTDLPHEPGVDWNVGYLSKPSREANYFTIRSTEMKELAGIPCPLTDIPRVEFPHQFHTARLGYTEIQSHGFYDPTRIAELKGPYEDDDDDIKRIVEFDTNKVFLAIDTEWRDFGRKNHCRLWTSAAILAAVHGHDITPRVVAYMTDDRHGRVIGMAIELLDDARVAGIEDIEECREVLGKLHSLGILSGESLRRLSFLIVEEEDMENRGEKRKKALMQGFTRSVFCDDKEQMRMEMDRLPEVLREEVEMQRPNWMAPKGSNHGIPERDRTALYSPVSPYRYKKTEKL